MSIDLTNLQAYDYHLPKELIAQAPLAERSASRLLHLHKSTGELTHLHFRELVNLLRSDDLMVVNSSKVFPARLFATKDNGNRIELLLLHELEPGVWQCLASPGKRLKQPQWLTLSPVLKGLIGMGDPEGIRTIRFEPGDIVWQHINQQGHIPLPPYIERSDSAEDIDRYQTVYAKSVGSVAAPTAGLHFDTDTLDLLRHKGITTVEVNLHVGIGTFRPVKVQDITRHDMHSEYASISPESAKAINDAHQSGRRIVCVGTTSVRTVESFWEDGEVVPGKKWTKLFIYPGYEFKVVQAMITNFHLPQSTLLMMISAFAGYDRVMHAYREAIVSQYRFFSYGDAMFIGD